MANAFFTALPGMASAAAAPALPQAFPIEAPVADPAAAWDSASTARGSMPGVTSPSTAIPAATSPGAALPGSAAPIASVSPPGLPFYFLENVPPGRDAMPAVTPGNLAALTAQSTTLPTSPDPGARGRAMPVSGAMPAFYFLDSSLPGWAATATTPLSSLGALTAQPPALPAGPDLDSPLPGALTGFYFLDSTLPDAQAQSLQGMGQHPPFNVAAIRADFPILGERVNGRPLIWLDNAATTQKPQSVIDRLTYFYAHENSNIHRAAHELAARATDAYEGARATVQRFLGASSPSEIIFVRGATEAINLVAQSWGRQNILAGDEIVVSHLEHHANIVPWQMLAREKGARLRVIPVDDSGQILLDEYQKLLNSRTKLVSVTQVSNALGTIVPVREVTELAHRAGARVLIDGAQAVSHMPVDVQALGADFYAFSGHKVFGPTGIGVLYGTSEVLESMPPWQGGGNMIAAVTFERTTYQRPPGRFEAGTGNIADAAGLAAALDYVTRIGMANIDRYEHDLLSYATAALLAVPGLRLIGTAREKASVLSFVLDGYDPVAVGTALNEEGIAVRAGHHCAEPILHRFGVTATVRPSLAFYNTCEEVDVLTAALLRLATRSGRK
jgi:cysteine desulfurase/selenocysteine lyase